MRADKESTTRLLRTARGQIDGILKMIDEDRYCIDIVNQLSAAESILRRVSREILAAHMQCCVQEAFAQDDPKEKINELVRLMEQMGR